MAKLGLLYCSVLWPERLLFSVSDCLLRWYAELLSPKESLKEICRGVTGGGLGGVRPCCARLGPSAVVVIRGRFSLPVARDTGSLIDVTDWLSAACRVRELSRWSESRRETWGGEGTSCAGMAAERGRRCDVRTIRVCVKC